MHTQDNAILECYRHTVVSSVSKLRIVVVQIVMHTSKYPGWNDVSANEPLNLEAIFECILYLALLQPVHIHVDAI
jgi:hypothetical protein